MSPTSYPMLNLQQGTDSVASPGSSRRDFLKRLGGGLVVFVVLGDWAAAQEGARPCRAAANSPMISTLRADWRRRPRDLLHGQDRDGPGSDHLPAPDGGGGTRGAAGERRYRHGRH